MTDATASPTPNAAAPERCLLVLAHTDDRGLNRMVSDMAAQLAGRGFSVRIAAFRGDGAALMLPEGLTAPDILSEAPRIGWTAWSGIGAKLKSLMTDWRPQTVITYQHAANLLGAWTAWRAGVPRRIVSKTSARTGTGPLTGLADTALGCTGVYSKVMAASHAVRSAYQGYPRPYRKRLAVVYPGLAATADGLPKREARQKTSLPAKARVLLAAGPFAAEGPLDHLLSVAEQLSKIQLVILDGPDQDEALRANLRARRLSNCVRFVTAPSTEERAALFCSADLMIEPAMLEPSTPAMLEAVRAGLPVVAADLPVQRETLIGETGLEAGVLLATDDPKPWAQTIEALLRDESRRDLLSAQGRDHAKAFSLDKMADALERLMSASPGPDTDGGSRRPSSAS